MFYYAFRVDIFQTALATFKYQTFCKTFGNLISKMSKRRANLPAFVRALTKIYSNYFQIFKKFYNTCQEFVDSLDK